eukprot:TRINITY_DN19095_c0_g1_i2.p1 TRINITY_DN19095_c0_g1~~TRINITY_DN19095_c0_g1_i2.p1  ORF type:complete len:256 (-),score=35.64 TRINITY_DN19095_c0_g1_i2:133-900(-)
MEPWSFPPARCSLERCRALPQASSVGRRYQTRVRSCRHAALGITVIGLASQHGRRRGIWRRCEGEVRQRDNATLGVVASKPFTAGELISQEVPLLLAKETDSDWPSQLCKQFQALPSQQRGWILQRGCPGLDASGELQQRISNCCLAVSTLQEAEYRALGKAVSGLKHSCSPNCELSLVLRADGLHELQVYASSDIAAGAELCVSYIDVLAPRQVRAKLLRDRFGVRCDCPACCHGGDHLALDPSSGKPSLISGE